MVRASGEQSVDVRDRPSAEASELSLCRTACRSDAQAGHARQRLASSSISSSSKAVRQLFPSCRNVSGRRGMLTVFWRV